MFTNLTSEGWGNNFLIDFFLPWFMVKGVQFWQIGMPGKCTVKTQPTTTCSQTQNIQPI